MSYDLVSIRQELDTAVASIPGAPTPTSKSTTTRYEETAVAISDVRCMRFWTDSDLLDLYLLKLCEIKAMELGVELDFEC